MRPGEPSGPDGAQKWFALISRSMEVFQGVGDATLNDLAQPGA